MDDDHTCPRCGGYLPTVTVQKPVKDKPQEYEEVEEIADCVRCTGGY